MENADVVKILYGILLGVCSYFLSRTGRTLERVEERVHDHESRLQVVEVITGIDRRHRTEPNHSGG